MIKRSRSSLVSNPITCWSVTHWVSTPRGMQCPQPKKTAGTFSPLERGAKAQLDIALRPSGERWAVPNDTSGVTMLVERLQPLHPTLIVLEATGGLERLVTSALAMAGLPVVVVNPRQARDF